MSDENIYFESGLPVDEATRRALRSDFASLIREHIAAQYGTQKDAERALGIPQSTVSNLMCGNTRRLSLDYLVGLAARLSIPWSAKCWNAPYDASVVAGPGGEAATQQNAFRIADDLSPAAAIERVAIRGS